MLKDTTTYLNINYITNEKTSSIKIISNLVIIALPNRVTIYRKVTDNNTRILVNIVNNYSKLWNNEIFSNLSID